MTTTPDVRDRLDELGDALRAAALADVARAARRRRRRTVAGVLAATAIVLPGAALATSALIGGGEVARSIPSGTWALMGTDPRCTTVRANVEFDCTLASVPKQGDIVAGAWKGTVEPTVDRSKRVNGGCRSLDGAGTHWRCYLGDEAVRQQTIGAGLLGQRSAGPSRG